MRRLKILIVIVVFLFSAFNCSPHKGASYQPKNTAYRLSNRDFIFNNEIDTQAIYSNMIVAFDGLKHYRFLRFSKDGICYYLIGSDDPYNTFEINLSSSNGTYGRYQLYDDNKIKIEIYDGGLGFIVYWYGTYDDKGVYFDKISSRKIIDPIRRIGDGNKDYYFYKEPADIYTKLKIPE
jgi:hypothetical protein